MEDIFKVLLDRKPNIQEVRLLYKSNVNGIKNYIKNLNEFKNFKDKNNKILKNIFYNITKLDSTNFNHDLYLKEFIYFNYDKQKMKNYLENKINSIKNEYKDFYYKYIDVKTEITEEEFLDILNHNYNIQNYICVSEKFHTLCDQKIDELLN